jgi:hypothetical protein
LHSISSADPFLATHREFAFYDCGASWIRTRLQDLGASFEEKSATRRARCTTCDCHRRDKRDGLRI